MNKDNVVCVCIGNGSFPIIKKKEILPFEAKWIDIEDNILNKIRQRKTNTT